MKKRNIDLLREERKKNSKLMNELVNQQVLKDECTRLKEMLDFNRSRMKNESEVAQEAFRALTDVRRVHEALCIAVTLDFGTDGSLILPKYNPASLREWKLVADRCGDGIRLRVEKRES